MPQNVLEMSGDAHPSAPSNHPNLQFNRRVELKNQATINRRAQEQEATPKVAFKAAKQRHSPTEWSGDVRSSATSNSSAPRPPEPSTQLLKLTRGTSNNQSESLGYRVAATELLFYCFGGQIDTARQCDAFRVAGHQTMVPTRPTSWRVLTRCFLPERWELQFGRRWVLCITIYFYFDYQCNWHRIPLEGVVCDAAELRVREYEYGWFRGRSCCGQCETVKCKFEIT